MNSQPRRQLPLPPTEPGVPARQKRRVFRWSKSARDLVRDYLETAQPRPDVTRQSPELKALVTRLTTMTGNPRDACLRFARQLGVSERDTHKDWTNDDKQRLLDLSARYPLKEAARLLGRSYSSVRSTLHRLGATAQMGRDWFTLYSLAEALHINADTVRRWTECGWLKSRVIQTGDLKRVIITADDFSKFCMTHRAQLLGRRINQERLEFVRTFVFPPSHAELLPVRDSKKERAAYKDNQTQRKIQPSGVVDSDSFEATG